MSPVKCKFISSIGATWACPPPVAPPFIPNTGPNEGSRSARIAFLPILDNPSAIPIAIVVFPSPNGVGFIDVTKINFPFCLLSNLLNNFLLSILALYFPYCSNSSSLIPAFVAISTILSNLVFLAISISSIVNLPLKN